MYVTNMYLFVEKSANNDKVNNNESIDYSTLLSFSLLSKSCFFQHVC